MEGLADTLRKHTQHLHTQAERSGFIGEMLQGRADRYGYALFLRNLLPVYRQLEQELEHQRQSPLIGPLALPAIYRTQALQSDLQGLYGAEWSEALPVLAAGERYRRRVADAAAADPGYLIAHAYVRYLGDLNGGRILRSLLMRSLNLTAGELAFYDFPAIDDLEYFKNSYRTVFNQLTLPAGTVENIIQEARLVFQLNIELSEAV